MSPNLTHVYLAAALLAAPAALGVASQTDTLPDTLSFAGDEAPPATSPALTASQEAQTIETFEGEVPEDVTSGVLDLRIDRGPIEIVGWEKDTYRIDVLAGDEANASQGETETTFEENVVEDRISLSLVVDHQETTGAEVAVQDERLGDVGQRAVLAHVPARLAYEQIHACEGQSTDTPADEVFPDEDDACVESTQTAPFQGSIHVRTEEASGPDVTWGIHGLEGEQAQLDAHNGEVALTELDFAKIGVATHNGAIRGANLTADELAVSTHNGQIGIEADAEEVTVDTHNGAVRLAGTIASFAADSHNGDVSLASPAITGGSVSTHNGAVDLQVLPEASGELDVSTHNGDVGIHLGHHEDVGYDVEASTHNGDVDIALVDEASDDDGADDEADESYEDGYEDGEQETARTAGYDELPIQLAITATTHNGAVEVLEETAEQGSDVDSEGSSSSVATTLAELL